MDFSRGEMNESKSLRGVGLSRCPLKPHRIDEIIMKKLVKG
jgi:hypothetical protein